MGERLTFKLILFLSFSTCHVVAFFVVRMLWVVEFSQVRKSLGKKLIEVTEEILSQGINIVILKENRKKIKI